jgi:FkbM family methyltransferase
VIGRYGLGLGFRGAIHVGAHLGQEAEIYRDSGLADVLWIEADPALLDELRANGAPFGHKVVGACLGATSGAKVILDLADNSAGTNRGMSSSVLPLGLHRERHPDVSYVGSIELTTRTLDSVVDGQGATGSNLLNMDVQGYELHVLEGAERTLPQLDCVYAEVNLDELYEGCALLPDLDAFLEDRGLTRVETRLWGSQHRDERDGETWFWLGRRRVGAKRLPPKLAVERWEA